MAVQQSESGHAGGVSPVRATLAGLGANLVGIGLARFAYTPLIPVLIAADWFAPAQVFYLGAANLAGYLAGALMARPMVARWPSRLVLRAMMLLATAAFFACATPISFWWFFVWRFASGYAGGALMVLAASTVLPHIPAARRGLAGGVIFTGVGLGVAASGTLLPLMLQGGLVATWCGLGVLSLLLTMLAWGGWPADAPAAPAPAAGGTMSARAFGGALIAIYLAYGLNAFGLVPHMVFLVDFVARGLAAGVAAGAFYWVLFGLGAMVGPMITGYLADRIGFRLALRLALLAQIVVIGLLAVPAGPGALAVSSLCVGLFVPGVVPLVLGRVHDLTAGDAQRQRAAWSLATVAFAVGQAAGAYGLSYLFTVAGSYPLLFAIGTGALLLALVSELTTLITAQNGTRPGILTRQR